MKKSLSILAFTIISFVAFPQNGLKIKTAIPTNNGMVSNIQVKFSEFYLDNGLHSQFSVYTQVNDSTSIKTFVVDPVYSFQLRSIPTIQIMWDSVANALRAKGLVIENL